MDNGTITSGNLLRLIGIMAIGVGVAWALQTIGFGGDASAFKQDDVGPWPLPPFPARARA